METKGQIPKRNEGRAKPPIKLDDSILLIFFSLGDERKGWGYVRPYGTV